MMKNELNSLTAKDDWRSIKVNFLIIIIFALLIISPIIMGNAYYVDDYYRLLSGNVRHWFSNGRPLAVFLTWILDFSTITTNTSPLPLLIGLFSCSLLLVLSFRKLPNMPDSMSILLSLSVIISPFLAQGMLYAFDSMAIVLSAGLAIYAISVMSKLDIRTGIFGFLLLVSTMCLYQASINYSLMLIITLFTVGSKGVDPLKLLMMRFGILSLSLIFYKLIIIPLSGMDEYDSRRGEPVSLNINGMVDLYHNFTSAFSNINLAFPGVIKWPLLMLFLLGGIACILMSWRLIKEKKLVHALITLASPFLIVIFIPGFILVLKHATFDPRVLGAFSTAVIFFFCVSYYTFRPIRKAIVSCLFIYVVFSAVFMSTLFRAAVNQAEFEDDVLISIRNSLAFYPENSFAGISFIGEIPYSPDIQPALHRYPYLSKYFTPALEENNEFRYFAQSKRVMLYAHLYPTTQAMKDYIPNQKMVSGCIFHLYKYESIAIVNFTMPKCYVPQ